mmetsp:Transcript_36612/g.95083  ORF Transcript_36612/g.95083 Transcript_36612/m.95083 type:complete len:260 (+) Transcript_36612:509-1288(+)
MTTCQHYQWDCVGNAWGRMGAVECGFIDALFQESLSACNTEYEAAHTISSHLAAQPTTDEWHGRFAIKHGNAVTCWGGSGWSVSGPPGRCLSRGAAPPRAARAPSAPRGCCPPRPRWSSCRPPPPRCRSAPRGASTSASPRAPAPARPRAPPGRAPCAASRRAAGRSGAAPRRARCRRARCACGAGWQRRSPPGAVRGGAPRRRAPLPAAPGCARAGAPRIACAAGWPPRPAAAPAWPRGAAARAARSAPATARGAPPS